jgi:hypothetical protein
VEPGEVGSPSKYYHWKRIDPMKGELHKFKEIIDGKDKSEHNTD